MIGKTFIALALAASLSTPAFSQGGTGTTSGYLTGYQPLEFRAALQPAAYGAPNVRFRPDPNMRQAVTRQVLSIVQGRDPALAGALGSKPFDTFGPALAAHHISDTNLTDSLAFMMIALWDAANASSAETTPGQTASVKRQAQNILAASLAGRAPATGSVQEASDSIWLSALTISILASKVLETRDPAGVAQLQDMASRESKASFGVDFRGLSFTEAGLSYR